MTEPKPTNGTIHKSVHLHKILTHEVQMGMKSDIQRDVSRAHAMPAHHAENVIKDAEKLKAKADEQLHHEKN
jgi:hypothetical protein